MASALINRMLHVELRASVGDWLEWAASADIHPYIIDYISTRPDHLTDMPPEIEAPFSTPRAWHMLSDAMRGYGDALTADDVAILVTACLSVPHGAQFVAYIKQQLNAFRPEAILSGEQKLPLQDRDLMYFVIMALRAYMLEHMPQERKRLTRAQREIVSQAQHIVRIMTAYDGELIQLMLGQSEPDKALPGWFVADLTTVIPSRLAGKAADGERKVS
jgi:hypothetical protein